MSSICLTCGKSFKHNSSLSRHISISHKNKEYECNVCHHKLSSKCSLDRHIRIKHRSDLVENSRPEYVKKEVESNNDSDDDTDNEQETNNKIDVDDNKELEVITNVSESGEDSVKTKGEEYKLFDSIDTPEDMRRRFKICDKVVTFRVKPPTGKYTTWMSELIYDLYDYFIRTYSHDENDSVGFKLICKNDYCERESNITPKVIKDLNFGEIIREVLRSPFSFCGELTVCYDHIPRPNPPSQIK